MTTETAKRPWTANSNGYQNIHDAFVVEWYVVDGEGKLLRSFGTDDLSEAHARMFAAGPEIVEALKWYGDYAATLEVAKDKRDIRSMAIAAEMTITVIAEDSGRLARTALAKLTAQEDGI